MPPSQRAVLKTSVESVYLCTVTLAIGDHRFVGIGKGEVAFHTITLKQVGKGNAVGLGLHCRAANHGYCLVAQRAVDHKHDLIIC